MLKQCILLAHCRELPTEAQFNDKVAQHLKQEAITFSDILKPVTCPGSSPNTLARVAELTRHVDQTEDLKGLGVKLYYGDTKVDSKVDRDADVKSRSCARDLLSHVISGLAAI